MQPAARPGVQNQRRVPHRRRRTPKRGQRSFTSTCITLVRPLLQLSFPLSFPNEHPARNAKQPAPCTCLIARRLAAPAARRSSAARAPPLPRRLLLPADASLEAAFQAELSHHDRTEGEWVALRALIWAVTATRLASGGAPQAAAFLAAACVLPAAAQLAARGSSGAFTEGA